VFAGHGRRSDRGDDVGEALVWSDHGRGREVVIVAGGLRVFRLRTVELLGVGGKCSEADGHAGRLEARRVERDDADRVVAIGLEVFYGDGGFLGRYVANCGLSVVIACCGGSLILSMPLIRITYFKTDVR
jgi:hypothetical protein